MPLDIEHLKSWVGKSETMRERIAPFHSEVLARTLDRDDPPYVDGVALPPLWHWLHFIKVSPLAEAGPDGHPQRGGFLPPVPLPRRMWAGSRLDFHRPLLIGDTIEKLSTIRSVEHKSGRSGELVFVTVRHEYDDGGGIALAEEHDIVYRPAAAPGATSPPAPPAPADHAFSRAIHPDPVMLFRYSAVTMNSHRIHYDQPYVTGVEGYAGLIVHGPLIATLLLDLLRRERPEGISPLFDTADFTVRGRIDGAIARLWAVNADGGLAMDGTAELG
jgi:3-methylfumaryl-CoA hydratase